VSSSVGTEERKHDAILLFLSSYDYLTGDTLRLNNLNNAIVAPHSCLTVSDDSVDNEKERDFEKVKRK